MEIRLSAPVALRTGFTGLQIRILAKRSKDAALARRLLALAEIFDGGSRSDGLRFNVNGPERPFAQKVEDGPSSAVDGVVPGG
jgi:hypothetical protein